MAIFYVCMRYQAKKSPIYVAYMQIEEKTFAYEGNNFTNCLMHIFVHTMEPKKSQPDSGRQKYSPLDESIIP
jgi:hypothetical protein